MNPFSLLNSTSLLFLGVLVLVCALLFLYFENKAKEQNHKISSMLSLVSSLTEEIHSIRRQIQNQIFIGGNVNGDNVNGSNSNNNNQYNDDDLVSVSDNDDTYDEDEDEDEDEDLDEDLDEDDEDDDDLDILEETCNNVIEIGDTIKVLTLLHPIELVSDGEDDDSTELDIDDTLGSSDEEIEEAKNIDITKGDIQMFDLKSIHLEEPAMVDYKKLSIGKLKTVVTEKGLASNTSKMKKQELLKLLGIDQ